MLRPFHALGLLLTLSAAPVDAQQTTYNYTGQPMVVTAAGPDMSVGQPNAITATITLAAPLAANAADQVVVPISYVLNGMALPNPQDWTDTPVFSFTTINGVIVAWNVSIDLSSANAFKRGLTVTSSGAGDTYDYDEIVDTDECNPFFMAPNCWIYDAVAYQRGVWVQQGQTPPITLTAALAEITTLQAQVTSLQSQLAAGQAQVTQVQGQLSTATTDYNSYLHGYIAENAIIAELNAALVAEKQLVAKCRANKGAC